MHNEIFTTSGGITCSADDLRVFRDMHRYDVMRYLDKPQTLNPRPETHFYVECHEGLTLNPFLRMDVGAMIARFVMNMHGKDRRKAVLIGIPEDGEMLASAAVDAAAVNGIGSMGFLKMRAKKSKRGIWVEGTPNHEKYVYYALENVVSSGKALRRWISHCDKEGYAVSNNPIITFIDREMGRLEKLSADGYDTRSVFTASTIIESFVHMKLGDWTQDRLETFRNEVAEHRAALALI